VPRLTRRHPSYRRHKSSGQAIVTLDGRDHYLGDFGSPVSKAEYDRLIAGWLTAGRQLPPPTGGAPADPSVNEVILAFWVVS